MKTLPVIVDRMPIESRKPRAGPLLDPAEAVAIALSSVPDAKRLYSPECLTVRAVLQALHRAGYKIEPR
jgi:hypothetical protein